MAVSSIPCHGLLNRWQIRIHEDIWSFNQVDNDLSDLYPTVYVQPERDDIANALLQAFRDARYYLGYHPKPVYEEAVIRLDGQRRWDAQTLSIGQPYLQGFGQRSTTLIQADVNVSYSGDTATITFATSVTDEDEVHLFFRTDDGAPAAADERYRIEPVDVSISGGTATVTGHKALFVHPTTIWDEPYTNDDPEARNEASKTEAGHFVTEVDAYGVTRDATGAATLLSEPGPNETALEETTVTPVLRDARFGEFVLRTDDEEPSRTPYAVRLNYLAGRDPENGQMFKPLETAIIRLANANLPEHMDNMGQRVRAMWERDRRYLSDDGAIPSELVNPLGLREGHVNAWLALARHADNLKGRTRPALWK